MQGGGGGCWRWLEWIYWSGWAGGRGVVVRTGVVEAEMFVGGVVISSHSDRMTRDLNTEERWKTASLDVRRVWTLASGFWMSHLCEISKLN